MNKKHFWSALNGILNKYWQPKGRHKSHATCYEVKKRIQRAFRIILDLGYKLERPGSLKQKHVRAMAQKMEEDGKAPSTIANTISALRQFAIVIGKPNLITDSCDFVSNPDSVRRARATDRDKTWSGAGIDPIRKIAEVEQDEPHVAIQLMLCLVFGLRTKEAMLLKPHEADEGTYLSVDTGTKGGRHRSVPIENEIQRAVLELAKELANESNGSMIPTKYSRKSWRNHFDYVRLKYGITKRNGCLPHGLRHEYANVVWLEMAGVPSAIKGGDSSALDPVKAKRVRSKIAERLGHSRPEITTAYYGSSRKKRKKKDDE